MHAAAAERHHEERAGGEQRARARGGPDPPIDPHMAPSPTSTQAAQATT